MNDGDYNPEMLEILELPCLVTNSGSILPGETGIIDVEQDYNINALKYLENNIGEVYVYCISRNEEGFQKYGVVSRIVEVLIFNDYRTKVMLQPLFRYRAKEPKMDTDHGFWSTEAPIKPGFRLRHENYRNLMLKSWASYLKKIKNKNIKSEDSLKSYECAEDVAFRILSSILSLTSDERNDALCIDSIEQLSQKVIFMLEREKEFYALEENISESVRKSMEQENLRYIKEKKVKILQEELGSHSDPEIESLEEELQKIPLSEANRKKIDAEIKKLISTPTVSPEYSLSQHYLQWVIDLPWGVLRETEPSIQMAEKILNADHYGLKKPKDRILEAIAVQIRTGKVSGNILCLMGPPGVGKTSLGQSIADATGRDFIRIALGGMKDEAEIRGHRRTYVGSQPGKIVKSLKSAGSMNPCILLDEVDKLGSDFRGDPSSALLEVLDPEQNIKFNDHFMDMDIDLSKVLFITTSNSWDIPEPLLDRMEVIELSSYTETEKISIAQKYLVPKALKVHGLSRKEIIFTKTVIHKIISAYTKEAGVRELERMIQKIARKRVREILESKEHKVSVKVSDMVKYLGVEIYDEDEVLKSPMVGISQGLAWTRYGGALLNIEAAVFPGQGKLQHTGSLGEVMQESIQASLTVTRSIGAGYGLDANYFDKMDIHIHLPEGATPKDGPSAGITLCTALISVVTSIPVKSNIAMTGEVNLRGEVLAIGGLKEKLLAALQAKISDVIIPKQNAREVSELPEEVKNGLNIHPVENIEQVLQLALTKKLTKSAFPKTKKSKK